MDIESPQPIQAPPAQNAKELVPLERLPFPPFVIVLATLTACAFLFSLIRAPGALSLAVGHQRSINAIKEGRPAEAVAALKAVVEKYPDDLEARIDLFEACVRGKQFADAIEVADTLDGKKVTDEQGQRLNLLDEELDRAHDVLKAGPPAEAVAPFKAIVDKFPDNVEARIDLFEAYVHAKQVPEALGQVKVLAGKTVTNEQERRLNQLLDELSKIMDERKAQAPKGQR